MPFRECLSGSTGANLRSLLPGPFSLTSLCRALRSQFTLFHHDPFVWVSRSPFPLPLLSDRLLSSTRPTPAHPLGPIGQWTCHSLPPSSAGGEPQVLKGRKNVGKAVAKAVAVTRIDRSYLLWPCPTPRTWSSYCCLSSNPAKTVRTRSSKMNP